ncbi:MAG TPA: BTAD domain-containing putative transcriptional regulator [Promineifilum sp.]|mgnify:CR=1 FL=1|nr:BTAD domain-containing putative transcriptional regulator [Promineifilum sp.]
MTALSVCLFGRFAAETDSRPVASLSGAKVQELFSYLLLYRTRPHRREALTTLLWPDVPDVQSKRYLRKTVWQLQAALAQLTPPDAPPILHVDPDWLQVSAKVDSWLDVAQFECSYGLAEDTAGEQMTPDTAARVEAAVELYRGDLLEGWYQEWCLFERERLERMYLSLLDKLISHCAAHGRYEVGIGYGTRALRHDPARERTHRRLMRLHALAGNRSEALHQYALCVDTLRRELGVTPSERTNALYQHILTAGDETEASDLAPVERPQPMPEGDRPLPTPNGEVNHALARLEQMLRLLGETQRLVQQNMATVAATLDDLRRDDLRRDDLRRDDLRHRA